MNNTLLHPKDSFNILTKNNEEYIVGYYSNNAFIIIKILKIDINKTKIQIEL